MTFIKRIPSNAPSSKSETTATAICLLFFGKRHGMHGPLGSVAIWIWAAYINFVGN